MVMDVFERSMHTDVYHERDPLAYEKFSMRSVHVISDLVDRSRAPVIVFKALFELPDVKGLMGELAPSRCVWIYRQFDDVVNSHLRLWPGMSEVIQRIAGGVGDGCWQGQGISEETMALVRGFAHEDMSDATACALFWFIRNKLFFEQGHDRDDRFVLVSYERLVENPETSFWLLFTKLGIPYSRRISDIVFSSSVSKTRKPEIDAGVRELCGRLSLELERCSLGTGD